MRILFGAVLAAGVTTALAGEVADKGDVAFQHGQWQQAEHLLSRRDDAAAQLSLAKLDLWRNRLDAARHRAKALARDAEHERAAAAILAEAYYRANDFQAAAPWFERADKKSRAELTRLFEGRTPYARDRNAAIELAFVHTDPLPLVQATIAKQPVNLIVDTGGAELLLSPELAKQAGVVMAPTQVEGTFAGGNKAPVAYGRLAEIELSGVRIADVPVNVLDTSKFAVAANGKPVHGVIGTVFLYQFLATIDYRQGVLRLLPRRASTDVAGEALWLVGDHYMVAQGSVQDRSPGMYFLDSGAAGIGLALSNATITEAGLSPDDAQAMTGQGGGGAVRVVPFVAKSVSLGADRAENIVGVSGAFPPTLEHAFGFRLHGIVSHAYFRSGAVTFDFDAMRVRIAR
jgi:tetratricopeptide (TPR) repeat protein